MGVVMAIWVPGGIWGLITKKTGIQFFPVGYWLGANDRSVLKQHRKNRPSENQNSEVESTK